eukprot:2835500-Heterocapsa_arctica.AAC.1
MQIVLSAGLLELNGRTISLNDYDGKSWLMHGNGTRTPIVMRHPVVEEDIPPPDGGRTEPRLDGG